MRITSVITLLALLFVVLPGALALTYKNETVKADITSFEWCFQPEFSETDMSIDRSTFKPYVISGDACGLSDYKLYMMLPVQSTEDYYVEECSLVDDTSKGLNANGTYNKKQVCTQTKKTRSITIIEKYDVTKNDMLYSKTEGTYFCYEAYRKASTNNRACDMNFMMDADKDGVYEYDTTSDGKTWWNTTWNYKALINVTGVSKNPSDVFNVTLNGSIMPYCVRSGDVRIVNSSEDGTIPFNITLPWNSTYGQLFINKSILNVNTSFYVYCNASTAQNTTGTTFLQVNTSLKTTNYFKFDLNGTIKDNVTGAGGTINGAPVWYSSSTYCGIDGCYYFDGSDDYLNLTIDVSYNQTTYSVWFVPTNVVIGDGILSNNGNTDWYLQIGGTLNLACYSAGDSAAVVSNTRYHILCVSNSSNSTLWKNSTLTAGAANGGTNNESLVVAVRGDFGTHYVQGYIDEIGVYNDSLGQKEANMLFNNNQGLTYPFYANPTVIINTVESRYDLTNLTVGLMNSSYQISPNNRTLEGEEFRFWANYTFDNSTVVNNTVGFCNYTGFNLSFENYTENVATNTSSCTAGCTYNTKSVNLSGFPTTQVYRDIYRFKLCSVGASKPSFTIKTNCTGESYTIAGTALPLCSQGYINYTITSKNCTAVSSIQINITGNGNNPANAIRLVDDFVGIDRFHNASGNMTFNSTNQLWLSSLYEQYEHASRNTTVNCYYNGSGNVENKSVTFTYTVQNILPVPLLDTIEDFYNGVLAFTNNIVVKFPSLGSLNITYLCSDDDFANATMNITLTSGVVINSQLLTNASGRLSFNTANFTRNQARTATLTCRDSQGEASTLFKNFTTEDLPPTFVWYSASGYYSPFDTPLNLTFNCSDPEGVLENATIYINGTLNTTTLLDYFNFSINDTGDYNVTGYCTDGVYNSSNASIMISIRNTCVLNLSAPCSGCRYQDNIIESASSCSNAANISSCAYYINDYARVPIVNCSAFNITAELGRNKFTFEYTSNLISQNMTLYFWAKKMDSDSWSDYSVMIILALISLLFFLMGFLSRMFWAVSGFCMWAYAYEVIAFSTSFALIVSVAGGLLMLLALFKKKKE